MAEYCLIDKQDGKLLKRIAEYAHIGTVPITTPYYALAMKYKTLHNAENAQNKLNHLRAVKRGCACDDWQIYDTVADKVVEPFERR